MSKEYEIREACSMIWRNMPQGVTTFGECSRKCGSGQGGRGSGPCIKCAIDDLTALVGRKTALKYFGLVKTLRHTELKMVENTNHNFQQPKTKPNE